MGGKASIILVMGFGLVIGYISLNLNSYATKAVGNMSSYYEQNASHNLALAGANAALSMIYQDTTWTGPLTQSLDSPHIRGAFRAQAYTLAGNRKVVRSVSYYPTANGGHLTDTVEVFFNTRRLNSFSMYAWMTNFEGNVFWVTQDTVWGRVHSNGNLHVNGSPVFIEKATTSKGFNPNKPGTGANKAIFKQGYETGVAEIPFPTDISEIINASTSGGRNYASTVWVTLDPGTAADGDGIAYIRTASGGPIVDSISLSDPAFNGVILGQNRVNVQGVLDGKLTISAMNDIFIQDDIVYAQSPLAGISNDLLGLVGNRNVVVADNTANSTDCRIEACIFAKDVSFYAENVNSRGLCGTLQVVGSIVQDERGQVGRFAGSALTSGFSKRYRFDPRLQDPTYRPPYFPGYYVPTYAISGWWESYRISRGD